MDYYPFDDDVIGLVNDVAKRQNRYDFKELAAQHNLLDGPEVIQDDRSGQSFEVLRIKPLENTDYDEHHARVYHAAHSSPITPGIAVRMLRLFECAPDQQMVIIGAPGMVGRSQGAAKGRDLPRIAGGSYMPLVSPWLNYLTKDLKLRTSDQYGYSGGTLKSLATTIGGADNTYDLRVKCSVQIEPMGLRKQKISRLAHDFISTGKKIHGYEDASNSRPLNDALGLVDRSLDTYSTSQLTRFVDSMKNLQMPAARYCAGLLRATNIALTLAMTQRRYEPYALSALVMQPDLHLTSIYGTSSEMVNSEALQAIHAFLGHTALGDRAFLMPVQGMHHAGPSDIDLHAALVTQATCLKT